MAKIKLNKSIVIIIIGATFFLGGIALAFFHKYPETSRYGKIIKELYGNFCAEFISIGLTVLLIDYLYGLRDRESLKKRLIRELGSEEKGFSSRALKELKENGWLSDGSLKNSDLSRANLSNLDLTDADLEGVDLQDADLSHSVLKNANLNNAVLNRAKLLNTNFENSSLINTTAQTCNFYQAILIKIKANGADFLHSNLEQAELTDAKIENSKLENINFQLSTLTRTEIIGCNLLRSDLNNANVNRAKFERCDFTGVQNWQTMNNRATAQFLGITNLPSGF